MDSDLKPVLERIANALERLAPPARVPPAFEGARLFRHDPATHAFHAAPDYALPLEALIGVDQQKARFVENLERFTRGLPANHVLLWGVRGTGKSSMTKAAFMAVAGDTPDLKLVEVDRDEVTALPSLFDTLRERPERFVVLCDDLSFEEGAAAAKALKSALEGGVSGPPANVLFVATSNRRHLMPRTHGEERGLIATAEDAEEEVSVSDRFGLWIGFPPMDQATYLEAVTSYARSYGLVVADLERRALQWAQLRGGRSGRVAWQFIRDLAGELGKMLPM
ncbi:MAG: ATP-binding protein [Phenylobacterium sp.]|uniref:ATP-binding protein n=1 Tax=Phenylobacterium sp. TaxID=1871053 RepID=UPI00271F049E|nr:ATP-binding protein [Phenylobacterium sp.]MDO8912851.1 ATP-binding protein [Phenylobacterium sp.]MDP3101549.1 ATP-binding protein [Phenylobacterium sp.]MDP3632108.1 ATP-binding protein [Phenylobacterium sp.]MDP3870207.1 ATP-binding protein [Phenylobacterium sp.]HQT53574.1 ATP-binding protein [Phenylobacterium sp.]